MVCFTKRLVRCLEITCSDSELNLFSDICYSVLFMFSQGLRYAVANAGKLTFTGEAQELYKQVVEKQTWLQDRDPTGTIYHTVISK